MTGSGVIAIATVFVLLAGPFLLWLAGWLKARHAASPVTAGWDVRLSIASALLFVLAFNLTFFIQELFLVLPKAFTPGLRPTLFHNNHSWDGGNPLASLFQGTGALATLLAGCLSILFLRRGASRSKSIRIFVFWMGYCGLFMALPQIVVGALSEQSDLGMFMAYFSLGTAMKTMAALIALALIPLAAQCLATLLLGYVAETGQTATAKDRRQFVFRAATLPALLALPLIALFRIPRELVEVLMVPVVVTWVGLAWIQAGAWRTVTKPGQAAAGTTAISWPLGTVMCLLLVFQVLLRPGIRFY